MGPSSTPNAKPGRRGSSMSNALGRNARSRPRVGSLPRQSSRPSSEVRNPSCSILPTRARVVCSRFSATYCASGADAFCARSYNNTCEQISAGAQSSSSKSGDVKWVNCHRPPLRFVYYALSCCCCCVRAAGEREHLVLRFITNVAEAALAGPAPAVPLLPFVALALSSPGRQHSTAALVALLSGAVQFYCLAAVFGNVTEI